MDCNETKWEDTPAGVFSAGVKRLCYDGVSLSYLRDEKKREEGIAKLERAAKTKYPLALYWISYYEGQDVQSVLSEAEKGDPAAQYELGLRYATGKNGLPKDNTEEDKWIKKAIAQQFPPAIMLYWRHGYVGVGVDVDNHIDIQTCRSEAEKSNLAAQYELGCRYINGVKGAPVNVSEGLGWIEAAANHGYMPAMWYLSTLYDPSRGREEVVKPSREKQIKWLEKAKYSIEYGDCVCNSFYCDAVFQELNKIWYQSFWFWKFFVFCWAFAIIAGCFGYSWIGIILGIFSSLFCCGVYCSILKSFRPYYFELN